MDDQGKTNGPVTDVLTAATAPAQRAVQIEKFAVAELTALRNELLRSGLDSWQTAEVASSFLAGHGYGVNTDHLRDAIGRMDTWRCSIECLQAELEHLAFIQ